MEEDVKVPFGRMKQTLIDILSDIAVEKMQIRSTKVIQKVLGMLIVVCGLGPHGNLDTFAEENPLT